MRGAENVLGRYWSSIIRTLAGTSSCDLVRPSEESGEQKGPVGADGRYYHYDADARSIVSLGPDGMRVENMQTLEVSIDPATLEDHQTINNEHYLKTKIAEKLGIEPFLIHSFSLLNRRGTYMNVYEVSVDRSVMAGRTISVSHQTDMQQVGAPQTLVPSAMRGNVFSDGEIVHSYVHFSNYVVHMGSGSPTPQNQQGAPAPQQPYLDAAGYLQPPPRPPEPTGSTLTVVIKQKRAISL